MSQYYVKLLPPIQLFGIEGDPILDKDKQQVEFQHVDFLLGRLNDNEFARDFDSIAIGIGIRDKLRLLRKQPTPYLVLDKDEWLKLCTSCRTPSAGAYLVDIAHNLKDAIEAVLKASDKDPATRVAVEL